MSFYADLQIKTATSRQQLYAVKQLSDGLQGNINIDTYIAYLTEAYHHVSHTVKFLMMMGIHLPNNKQYLQNAIADYIKEEVGHEEWILNDIDGAGGNKEEVRKSTPALEAQLLIAYNYDYIQRKNPVGFLGMVYMLESTSVQLANHGANSLKEKLKLKDNAFSYLYSHGELDQDHMVFFEKTVNTITDKKDQAAIIEVANNTFTLFKNMLSALPHTEVSPYAD